MAVRLRRRTVWVNAPCGTRTHLIQLSVRGCKLTVASFCDDFVDALGAADDLDGIVPSCITHLDRLVSASGKWQHHPEHYSHGRPPHHVDAWAVGVLAAGVEHPQDPRFGQHEQPSENPWLLVYPPEMAPPVGLPPLTLDPEGGYPIHVRVAQRRTLRDRFYVDLSD